jgi:hypothetical protein
MQFPRHFQRVTSANNQIGDGGHREKAPCA